MLQMLNRQYLQKLARLSLVLCAGLLVLHFYQQNMLTTEDSRSSKQTADEEFNRRKKRVNDVCASTQISGRVHGVFTDPDSGVLYCFVPKAGCTFWKRVFKIATFKMNATRESLYSISRIQVHEIAGAGEPFTLNHNWTNYPTRFIVTRDPYSRLLSAYLDKIYLPDFWQTEMIPLLKMKLKAGVFKSSPADDFFRQHFNKMESGLYLSGNSQTSAETSCGKYLTFAEFLHIGFFREEPHWMPIHEICNPCVFNVTHVIHMESFTDDSMAILSKMGLESILEDFDHVSQTDQELKTIINYNFELVNLTTRRDFYKNCLTPIELAYRLWSNFVWRGYIHPDSSYSIPNHTDPAKVKLDLESQVWRARERGLKEPKRMKDMKKRFLISAYRTIPRTVFDMITSKYDLDFKLFGYEDVRDKLRGIY